MDSVVVSTSVWPPGGICTWSCGVGEARGRSFLTPYWASGLKSRSAKANAEGLLLDSTPPPRYCQTGRLAAMILMSFSGSLSCQCEGE